MVLDMLQYACEYFHVADRGHKRSNGTSETTYQIPHGKPLRSSIQDIPVSDDTFATNPCSSSLRPEGARVRIGHKSETIEYVVDSANFAASLIADGAFFNLSETLVDNIFILESDLNASKYLL